MECGERSGVKQGMGFEVEGEALEAPWHLGGVEKFHALGRSLEAPCKGLRSRLARAFRRDFRGSLQRFYESRN